MYVCVLSRWYFGFAACASFGGQVLSMAYHAVLACVFVLTTALVTVTSRQLGACVKRAF
jgi:hypothetical protein